MSNFTTENIGAFELNGAVVLSSDAALEAIVAGPPTLPTANCRVPTGGNPFGCIGQDDGALEGLAGTLSATPSNPAMCGPIPPTIHPAVCGRIDDGALEAAAVAASGPTIQYCNTMVGANCPRRIDDGVNSLPRSSQVEAPRCPILQVGPGRFRLVPRCSQARLYRYSCSRGE